MLNCLTDKLAYGAFIEQNTDDSGLNLKKKQKTLAFKEQEADE